MPVAPVGHFADLFTVDAEARERAREALAEAAPGASSRPGRMRSGDLP
jgi:hypothetical protein